MIYTGLTELSFTINGVERSIKVEPRDTLLDVLRDKLDLTGAKKGCDEAVCGACSVLYNGISICSCTIFALEAEGSNIVTIEGFRKADNSEHDDNSFDPIQRAFVQYDAQQCGFCTSGQIISAKSFINGLDDMEEVGDDTIREALSGNICRCGCYNNIVQAVQHVIKEKQKS